MSRLKLVLAFVSLGLLLLFIGLNLHTVEVSFIFFKTWAPASVLVILSAMLGAVATVGFFLFTKGKK